MNKRDWVLLIAGVVVIVGGMQEAATAGSTEDDKPEGLPKVVQGCIRGTDVVLENASFENGQLAVHMGDSWAFNPSVLIFLFLEKGIIPDNKLFSVKSDVEFDAKTPHIHCRWEDVETGQIKTEIVTSGYDLSLKFGQKVDGKIPGKIMLEIPGKDTRLEGLFSANIKSADSEKTPHTTPQDSGPKIAGVPDYSKPLTTQLREGDKKQREKDFEGAIQIYLGIVANDKAEPKYLARAYYRLGRCYLKKGDNDKAIEQFEYLIQNFPDQGPSVTRAKAQLKRLGGDVGKQIDKPKRTSLKEDPTVISTTPALFTNNVSPGLDKISFTFDRPMKDGNWAWTQFDESTYPQMVGQPSFDRKRRTCTHRVRLKPSTAYIIGINQEHKPIKGFKGIALPGGFMSTSGKKAKPYVLVFATKSPGGNPTPIPEDLIAKAKKINLGTSGPEITSKKTGTKRVQKIDGTELSHVDVKATENLRYCTGPDYIVKYTELSHDAYLKGIWIYGARSEYGKQTKQDSFICHLLLCDKDLNVIEDFPFTTSEFSDKYRHWVGLELSPKRKLPSEFIIRLNSDKKTLKMAYNPREKGNSSILTEDGDLQLWHGEWMIIPVVGKFSGTPK